MTWYSTIAHIGRPVELVLNYAIKRILLAVLILFVVMLAMYAMVFLVPGDPATVALGPRATPELKRQLIERMGLDQPILYADLQFLPQCRNRRPWL